jgi:hypothetical protein
LQVAIVPLNLTSRAFRVGVQSLIALEAEGEGAPGPTGPLHLGRAAPGRRGTQLRVSTPPALFSSGQVRSGQVRSGQVRSGQVRSGILLGQNLVPLLPLLRPRESQGSLGYLRGIDGLESSYARIDGCGTAQPSKLTKSSRYAWAIKPVTRKARSRARRCNFGARACACSLCLLNHRIHKLSITLHT